MTQSPWDTPEVQRHHAHLLDAYLRVAEAYPKAIMLLSGGALALSITFLEKAAGVDPPHAAWALRLGWAMLVVSLLTVAMSMLLSLGLLERATQNYAGLMDRSWQLPTGRVLLTKILNVVAAVTLSAGLALLAVFASSNIKEEAPMPKEPKSIPSQPRPSPKQDSYVPSPPPLRNAPVPIIPATPASPPQAPAPSLPKK